LSSSYWSFGPSYPSL